MDQFSREVLQHYAELLALGKKAAQDPEGITAEDFLAEVAGISPEFRNKLGSIDKKSMTVILIAFFLILKACQGGVTININTINNYSIEQSERWEEPGFDPQQVPLPRLDEKKPLEAYRTANGRRPSDNSATTQAREAQDRNDNGKHGKDA